MINLMIAACPMCGRTNIQQGTNEKHAYYLCKTHGWFSKNEIKESLLENIVEDLPPFVPPHRKNISTQEFSAIAQEHEGKLKNPLEFGQVKRNNYNIAHIAKALAGEHYLPNGKRMWFWKNRTEKAREFYKKIDYHQLTESQHSTLKRIVDALGKNPYLQEERQDILSKFYIMNGEPMKAVQSSIKRYTAPVQHGLEKIAKRKSFRATETACALSTLENTPLLKKDESFFKQFKKKDMKYYVIAGVIGLIASGGVYLIHHYKAITTQKSEEQSVVNETKKEAPKKSQSMYLSLDGKLLDVAKKRGLWGVGKYLGVDDGKNNSTIIRFTQETGGLNSLPKNDREKDGIVYDIWSKEDLQNGKLMFSQEMIEKYNLDTKKLQH